MTALVRGKVFSMLQKSLPDKHSLSEHDLFLLKMLITKNKLGKGNYLMTLSIINDYFMLKEAFFKLSQSNIVFIPQRIICNPFKIKFSERNGQTDPFIHDAVCLSKINLFKPEASVPF